MAVSYLVIVAAWLLPVVQGGYITVTSASTNFFSDVVKECGYCSDSSYKHEQACVGNSKTWTWTSNTQEESCGTCSNTSLSTRSQCVAKGTCGAADTTGSTVQSNCAEGTCVDSSGNLTEHVTESDCGSNGTWTSSWRKNIWTPRVWVPNEGNSKASFADVDGDGDKDMVVGNQLGTVWFYKNIGDSSSPDFVRQMDLCEAQAEAKNGDPCQTSDGGTTDVVDAECKKLELRVKTAGSDLTDGLYTDQIEFGVCLGASDDAQAAQDVCAALTSSEGDCEDNTNKGCQWTTSPDDCNIATTKADCVGQGGTWEVLDDSDCDSVWKASFTVGTNVVKAAFIETHPGTCNKGWPAAATVKTRGPTAFTADKTLADTNNVGHDTDDYFKGWTITTKTGETDVDTSTITAYVQNTKVVTCQPALNGYNTSHEYTLSHPAEFELRRAPCAACTEDQVGCKYVANTVAEDGLAVTEDAPTCKSAVLDPCTIVANLSTSTACELYEGCVYTASSDIAATCKRATSEATCECNANSGTCGDSDDEPANTKHGDWPDNPTNPFHGVVGATGGSPKHYWSAPALEKVDAGDSYDLVVGNNKGTFLYWKNTDACNGGDNSDTCDAPVYEAQDQDACKDGTNDAAQSAQQCADVTDLDNATACDSLNGCVYDNTDTDNPTCKIATTFAVCTCGTDGTASTEGTDCTGNNDRSSGKSGLWTVFTNPFHEMDVGWDSTLTFVDLDSDGDRDIVGGNNAGGFKYYKSNLNEPRTLATTADIYAHFTLLEGTGTDPATGNDTPFNGVTADRMSAPAFYDVDNDGDLELITGQYDGKIRVFDNGGTVPDHCAGMCNTSTDKICTAGSAVDGGSGDDTCDTDTSCKRCTMVTNGSTGDVPNGCQWVLDNPDDATVGGECKGLMGPFDTERNGVNNSSPTTYNAFHAIDTGGMCFGSSVGYSTPLLTTIINSAEVCVVGKRGGDLEHFDVTSN